jgi:hypothetical protein
MTDATCRPVAAPLPVSERERQTDRMTELLDCLADLLVQTAEQRATIERAVRPGDSTARHALARLTDLEQMLKGVGLEAASVHQLLQHEHLI